MLRGLFAKIRSSESDSDNGEGKTSLSLSRRLILVVGILFILGSGGFMVVDMMSGPPSGQQAEQQYSGEEKQEKGPQKEGGTKDKGQVDLGLDEEEDRNPINDEPLDKDADRKKRMVKEGGGEEEEKDDKEGHTEERNDRVEVEQNEESEKSAVASNELKLKSKDRETLKEIESSLKSMNKTVKTDLEEIGSQVGKNKKKIRELSDNIKGLADSVPAKDKEDRTSLESKGDEKETAEKKKELKELEDKVRVLEEENKDLKGRYKYVRKLEQDKARELKKLRAQLTDNREKNADLREKLDERPLFSGWKIAGLSSDQVILKNLHDDKVRKVSSGESFQGVEIQRIDVKDGAIHTSSGVYKDIAE